MQRTCWLAVIASALMALLTVGCGNTTDPQALRLYHAGSLNSAFTQAVTQFTNETGIAVLENDFAYCKTCNSASAGSLDLARHIADGTINPTYGADLYASADYQDLEAIKPISVPYNIVFSKSQMVLAYAAPSTTSTGTKTPGSTNYASVITSSGTTCKPSPVASNWSSILTASGVKIAGSDPNLDPSGYRSFYLIPELAEKAGMATAAAFQNNYYLLLASDVTGPTDPKVKNTISSSAVIGQTGGYDYSFTYESSAKTTVAAGTTPGYCYAYLPATVSLGDPTQEATYSSVSFASSTPVGGANVTIAGSRTKWGITILNKAPRSANAVKFLQFLLGPEGQSILNANGPPAITPAVVSPKDFSALPAELQPLVTQADPNTF